MDSGVQPVTPSFSVQIVTSKSGPDAEGFFRIQACNGVSGTCTTVPKAIKITSGAPIPDSYYDKAGGAYYVDSAKYGEPLTQRLNELSSMRKDFLVNHLLSNTHAGWHENGGQQPRQCIDIEPCTGMFEAASLCCSLPPRNLTDEEQDVFDTAMAEYQQQKEYLDFERSLLRVDAAAQNSADVTSPVGDTPEGDTPEAAAANDQGEDIYQEGVEDPDFGDFVNTEKKATVTQLVERFSMTAETINRPTIVDLLTGVTLSIAVLAAIVLLMRSCSVRR